MRTLSIDIETYSSVNLQKSGVYKYASSGDFEILLFGYSVDGGEVQVVDLALGEAIPQEILDALKDDEVIKWAFNASFERICLSVFLGMPVGEYLSPASWRCSMIWSATLGLPLSLEGVGAVLGLEKQKLTEGKNLIKYFCVPCAATKVNGGRTRNLPMHDMEKWKSFKAYNLRDVETEMGIQQKLARFPVSNEIWDEYHLNEEINDRGIGIDMVFVEGALCMDSKSKKNLTETMQEMTNLENPNSVQQMKNYLAENGLEMESLGKKEVAEILKVAPEHLREVLSLRQQLAKSSVKKYTAMQNAVCSDGRARGMFQFYGANRTGNNSLKQRGSNMDKQAEYLRLAKDIRKCHLCTGLKVPSFNEDGECLINDNHGIDEMNNIEAAGVYVNRWNLWQGNLDADIMVLGQDYGHVDAGSKQDNDWKQNDVNKWLFQTDRNLYKIFKEVFHYDLKDDENLPLFFLNIACCYRKNKSTGATNDGWFSLCANKYMGRLIRIVQPKVIVCFGMKAFEYLAYCDDMQLVCVSDNKLSGEPTLTKLLDDGYKFELRDNKVENAIPVVLVFHPGLI